MQASENNRALCTEAEVTGKAGITLQKTDLWKATSTLFAKRTRNSNHFANYSSEHNILED